MIKKDSVEYNLFNKFTIDALDSLKTILDYSDKNNEYYGVIDMIYKEKIEENRNDYEGMNEYDAITRMLNCNLSEIRSNTDSMSSEELVILKRILESARSKMSSEKISKNINSIIKENEDSIDKCLPEAITDKEIEILLHKLVISELDTIYIMAINSYDIDESLIKLVEKEYDIRGFKNRKNVEFEAIQMEAGLNYFICNLDLYNNRELTFLESLVIKSHMYISSIFTNNDVYESAVFRAMIDLEEKLHFEKENRSNNKTLTIC